MNKLFGKKETGPARSTTRQAYLYLVATVPVTKEMSDQIFPYALQQLCQTHATFKELYNEVESENTPVARNTGMASSKNHFADGFVAWLNSVNVHPGDFKPLINKQVFIFGGDAKNPKDGKSFPWGVMVYFDMAT